MKNQDPTKAHLVENIGALQKQIGDLKETVAAHRQAEDALKTSEKNLSIILEKNADGIIIIDPGGTVLYVNPAAEMLFGRSRKEFLDYPFGFPVAIDKTQDIEIIRRDGVVSEAELRVVQIHWPDRPALLVSVRDITERKRAEEAALQAREHQARIRQLEQEIHALSELSGFRKTNVTARLYGVVPLVEAFPDTFQELVNSYKELWERALEQQVYRVEHNISGRLTAIAETLGFYKASPRDVVDIHVTALREKSREESSVEKREAYTGEGWMLVLELMGHLASFYRNRADIVSKRTAPKAEEGSGDPHAKEAEDEPA
jgi:PAS domain-containing protein